MCQVTYGGMHGRRARRIDTIATVRSGSDARQGGLWRLDLHAQI